MCAYTNAQEIIWRQNKSKSRKKLNLRKYKRKNGRKKKMKQKKCRVNGHLNGKETKKIGVEKNEELLRRYQHRGG